MHKVKNILEEFLTLFISITLCITIDLFVLFEYEVTALLSLFQLYHGVSWGSHSTTGTFILTPAQGSRNANPTTLSVKEGKQLLPLKSLV